MKRHSHYLIFCLIFCFLAPKFDLLAKDILFSWFFFDCDAHTISSKPYFEEAYQKYPTIPIGMLEAVSFSYTRLESRVWPDTVFEEKSDIPATYTIMGLTLDGKGNFRENLHMVSALSGVREEDIIQDDRTAVMAYAAAFATLQKKYKCYTDHVEDYRQILIDLSEIPLQCEFALNCSLYSIYMFLADSNVVQYGIPRREIDFRQVFGDRLHALQQKSVLLDASSDTKGMQTVDYPNAIWVPASSCNYSSRNGTQVTNVTIHYTSGTYAGAIAWFQNCNAGVSAHYVIRSIDGQVTQMVRESDKAWHVGVANGYTIGIEHEAYGDIASFFTPAMYASSAALVRDICARHPNINPLHTFYRDTLDNGMVLNAGLHSLGGSAACTQIRGHQHFPSQTHTDPGPYWDWNYYYKLINTSPQIDSTSSNTGVFTDSGGTDGDYSNNERRLFLIHVPHADSIALVFSVFDLEPDYDFMWIYEGNTVFSRLLGRWNTQSPGRVVAHGENILVEFRSDCGTVASGWLAHWTGYCTQEEMLPPTTRILVDEQSWKSRDFQVAFQDSDDVAVRYRFFQIMERNGNVWSANPRTGFFCDNFDTSLNVQFSTYAVPMIIGEIKRFLRDGNSLRIARSIRDTAYRALKTRNEIEKKDEEASLERIAEEMNVKLSEVVYALDAISDTVSLYDPVYNKNGDELLLLDQIGDERNNEELWSDKVAIDSALKGLENRERKIIYLRYFEGKTQTEISETVGISQAQVSRLEKTALKEIKEKMRAF